MLKKISDLFTSKKPISRPNQKTKIDLECLEDRLTPATDSGSVSLSPMSDIVSQHKAHFSVNYEKSIGLPDLSFSIDFGDGSSREDFFPVSGKSTLTISHTFQDPGKYNISVITKTSDITTQSLFDGFEIEAKTVGLIGIPENTNDIKTKFWAVGGTSKNDLVILDSKEGQFISVTINGNTIAINPNPQLFDSIPDRYLSIKTGDGNDFVVLRITRPNGMDRFAIHDIVSELSASAELDLGAGKDTLRINATDSIATPRKGVSNNLDFQFVMLGSYYGRPYTYTDHFFVSYSGTETLTIGKTPLEGQVALLYQTLLYRTPSEKEVSMWVAQIYLKGYAFAANQIFYSYESCYNTVNEWYKLYLGRNFTRQEASHWIGSLMAKQSRESLLASFLSTPEFLQLHARGTGRDQQVMFVKSLYQQLLAREPTATEIGQQIPANAPKKDFRSIALSFLSCSEYREREIQNDYWKFLYRGVGNGNNFPISSPFFTPLPPSNEVKAWSQSPLSLNEIRYRFITSPEFTRSIG